MKRLALVLSMVPLCLKTAVLGTVLFIFLGSHFAASAQTDVQDIFGRALDQRGLTLVDWDGYMANPLLKFYLLPPTNAVLPGTAMLTANGARLYFDTPSSVSTSGPSKTISLPNASTSVPVRLSIFPDRDNVGEDYTLTIVFTGANNVKQTNTVPIHVIDLDLQRTNDFLVTVDFDRDITGFFTNSTARSIVTQAADDWTYFFSGMNLDAVPAGTESTFIWSNDFSGGYYFSNTDEYTGYLLYAYGTENSVHRSGGEASFYGGAQTSGGVPLTLHRSGGFEAEIHGNFNTLGWLFLTNDESWLVTGNFGNQTNDFYSIAHHEIGHALVFNVGHPGFNTAKTNGAFTSAAVTNYYGGPVPIDGVDHLNGVIDPESGQGAFGYEYFGNIPRYRWLMTKTDLLCAQEIGYMLRSSAAFNPLTLVSLDPPSAVATIPFTHSFTATGGIPFYNWDITAGSLPPGLVLDSFTGALTGTPTSNGTFNFTLRVRDYHETGDGVTHSFAISVVPPPPSDLAVKLDGPDLQLSFSTISSNLYDIQYRDDLSTGTWLTLTNDVTGTGAPLTITDPNAASLPKRFYRVRVHF